MKLLLSYIKKKVLAPWHFEIKRKKNQLCKNLQIFSNYVKKSQNFALPKFGQDSYGR